MHRLENAPLDENGCLPDIELPESSLHVIPLEKIDGVSEKEKLNFLFFGRGESVFKIPKSTILFMITEKGKAVPIDRLQRFVTDKKQLALINSTNGRSDKICVSDWTVMKHVDIVYYCLVLGFRYTAASGIKRKFRQNFCPITKPGQESAGLERVDENVEVQVNTFLASTGGILTLHNAFDNENNGFINISRYFTHVEVSRNLLSGKFYIN